VSSQWLDSTARRATWGNLDVAVRTNVQWIELRLDAAELFGQYFGGAAGSFTLIGVWPLAGVPRY